MCSRVPWQYVVIFSVAWSGCGTDPLSNDQAAQQSVPDLSTDIPSGIYAGKVECDYESRNSAVGVVESYTYDFNETFAITTDGVPRAGVAVDPNDDQITVFGIDFDVTNRTFDASATRYVENAWLTGSSEGNVITGLWTWTFTYLDTESVRYQLDLSWTYSESGVPWSITEACTGTLVR